MSDEVTENVSISTENFEGETVTIENSEQTTTNAVEMVKSNEQLSEVPVESESPSTTEQIEQEDKTAETQVISETEVTETKKTKETITEETSKTEGSQEESAPVEIETKSDATENVSETSKQTEEVKENTVKEIESPEIKEELKSILKEIDESVEKEEQEEQKRELEEENKNKIEFEEEQNLQDGELHHTWKPRGKYDLVKTKVAHDDVVAIAVDEVKEPEPVVIAAPEPNAEHNSDVASVNHLFPEGPIIVPQLLPNGELGSPIAIPEGIPLLARVLPKEEDSHREKIPLERLFTPATDSGDITPRKKKAFASSDFYAKDHPTIDDQLQLAQRISGSLADQNNKTSRGQAMYERRKEKSEKWIHQEGGKLVQKSEVKQEYQAQGFEMMDNQPTQKTRPAMKLVMNPKGVQDHTTVEQHYQQLMEQSNSSSISSVGPSHLLAGAVQMPASPEIAKDLINDMQSPTGKGAALFAKRKKRMDKFIVDETNVQKTSAYSQEQQSSVSNTVEKTSFNQFNSSSSVQQKSSISTSSTVKSNKKKSVQERDKEQKQIMENLMKTRESEFKLVKSPWESVLETGTTSAAFQKNLQQQSSLLSAGSINAGGDASLNFPSWMEMPKAVPVTAPMPKSGTSEPLPTHPSLFGNKPQEPLANDRNAGLVYTAEVKVQQTSSVPGTPTDQFGVLPTQFPASAPTQPAPAPLIPQQAPAPTGFTQAPIQASFASKPAQNAFVPRTAAATLSLAELEDRRKSANFNLAANGWGKCNSYYKPVTFAS